MDNEKKWFEKFVKPIGVNMWAPEWYPDSIRRFDADKLAEMMKKCDSTVGFTFQGFSQDHFGVSYFQTGLGHKHANLSGNRDHMAEYQAALKKVGAKYFAYYCCLQDRFLWDRFPDWRVIDEHGDDSLTDNFGCMCPNSPYRDHLVDRLSEIQQKYNPDGWILDMLVLNGSKPVCFCEYCKRKYCLQYGRELPSGTPSNDENWRLHIRWRYKCIEELFRDIACELKRINPDTVITHNAFALRNNDEWTSGEDYEELFKYDDVVTNIAAVEYGVGGKQCRSSDLVWKAGYFTRVFRGLSEKPVWMQTGRFMYSRDYTILPERELEATLFSIITNGGCPFIIDNVFPDGTVEPVAVERMANVYQKIKEKEQYLNYDGELCQTGVLYSKSSQDWSDLATPGQGRYGQSFMGICKTLLECHIPYRVLREKGLSEEKLNGLKCLILGDCAVISENNANVIKAFVKRGGTLISMGKTGIIDEDGKCMDESRLSDALGVSYREPLNYKVNFVIPGDNEVCRLADKRQILPLRECYPERFYLLDGARQVMSCRLPSTEVIPKKRMFTYGVDVAPGRREEPFAAVNTYGDGRTLYIGGNLARDYGIYGNPDVKKLIEGAYKWGAATPFTTDAPGCVELACYKNGKRYILHLINYASGQLRGSGSAGGHALDYAIPVHNIKVTLEIPGFIPKSVWLEDGTPVEYKSDENSITFNIVVLDVHLLVVLE